MITWEPSDKKLHLVTDKQNPYLLLGRERKRDKLVAILQRYGFTADDVASMLEYHWQLAASGALVTMPSPETRAMVLDSIRRAEVRNAGNYD